MSQNYYRVVLNYGKLYTIPAERYDLFGFENGIEKKINPSIVADKVRDVLETIACDENLTGLIKITIEIGDKE